MDGGTAMSLSIWKNCTVASLQADAADGYGLIPEAALVIEGERIVWLGRLADLPSSFSAVQMAEHDAGGALITPGFIDCHTHLVYDGHRADEFEMRLQGASYLQIAQAGGGIVSTVRATREANKESLTAQSLKRLDALIAEGVTSIEIKSGYGLALEHERKCLQVARDLARLRPIDVSCTFLGAHAVPPEFAGQADAYVDEVLRMLAALHTEGLVDAVDVFCEKIGFSIAQTQRVFEVARGLGLPVKMHAEQLSDSQGAALAASFGALSCDHLEWLSPQGAQAMANADSVAVLLPGAFYFLRETKLPPVDMLRQLGVPIAVSTDCNPGSSPCTSLLLMLNMACTLFGLTPAEALAGVTRHAAKALGLKDRGSLAVGQRADFVLWDVRHPSQLCYAFGVNPRITTIYKGKRIDV
jgi:imidazolonepropionase